MLLICGNAGTWHDGFRAEWTIWPDLPARQLHLWTGITNPDLLLITLA
jgi:hypothetical protein